jgi:hypothetical protein
MRTSAPPAPKVSSHRWMSLSEHFPQPVSTVAMVERL